MLSNNFKGRILLGDDVDEKGRGREKERERREREERERRRGMKKTNNLQIHLKWGKEFGDWGDGGMDGRGDLLRTPLG